MERTIQIDGRVVTYTLRRSTRARNIRLSVYPKRRVQLTVPHRMAEQQGVRFLREKADWLFSRLDSLERAAVQVPWKGTHTEYTRYAEKAQARVQRLIDTYNEVYGFSYARVSIRNQKTRWGSCSQKGNLNFNYRIIFLPERLAAYVVVHELCHLRQLNHSPAFWRLVAQTLPEWRAYRKELHTSYVL